MQPTPTQRPEKTLNATAAVAVLTVDDAFVVGADIGGGRWCLPTLEVPPDYALTVVLKKFLKDAFQIELRELIEANRISFGSIFVSYSAESNIRTFQHTLIVKLTREILAKSTAPDSFSLLPLDQIIDAPADMMALNHHQIICSEVGK